MTLAQIYVEQYWQAGIKEVDMCDTRMMAGCRYKTFSSELEPSEFSLRCLRKRDINSGSRQLTHAKCYAKYFACDVS